MTNLTSGSETRGPEYKTLERKKRAGFASLLRARDGAVAVEFALISAPFIALLLAILQVGVIYFAQESLETVVEQTARLVLTGQAPGQGGTTQTTDATTFAQKLCANSPALFNCSGFMIDLQPTTSFPSANLTAPAFNPTTGNLTNPLKYNPGSPGDVMVMRVMYLWPVFLGPLGLNLANVTSNTRLLMATAVFKNEP